MILEVALSLKIVVLPQWAQHGLAAPSWGWRAFLGLGQPSSSEVGLFSSGEMRLPCRLSNSWYFSNARRCASLIRRIRITPSGCGMPVGTAFVNSKSSRDKFRYRLRTWSKSDMGVVRPLASGTSLPWQIELTAVGRPSSRSANRLNNSVLLNGFFKTGNSEWTALSPDISRTRIPGRMERICRDSAIPSISGMLTSVSRM